MLQGVCHCFVLFLGMKNWGTLYLPLHRPPPTTPDLRTLKSSQFALIVLDSCIARFVALERFALRPSEPEEPTILPDESLFLHLWSFRKIKTCYLERLNSYLWKNLCLIRWWLAMEESIETAIWRKKVGKRWLHELLLDEWISYLRDLWELFGVRVNYLRDLWELFDVKSELFQISLIVIGYLRVIWELVESYFPTHFSNKYFKKQHQKKEPLKFGLKFQGKVQTTFEVWFEISMQTSKDIFEVSMQTSMVILKFYMKVQRGLELW